MPNTPEEEAHILQLTQLINARHGAAKPQNTIQAGKSAAKLWKRYREQEAHRCPDGDLMSQARILEISMWLVDEAVQQNGARYSFSSAGDYLSHLKEVRSEQYSQGRITSDVPAPLEMQAVRDLLCARGREMQAENLNAQVAAQVDAALSAGQLRQSLQPAFQQKQWQWAYLLRMAMTFMPATLGRSDDLRKGKTVKPGQVDILVSSGVPCGRLDGYSAKGEVSHKFKKHGVEAAKSVGINKAEIKMAARHESDTTDLYCIFDPDTAQRLAGWGRDWHEIHRLGQAEFKAEEDVLDCIIPGLTVLLRQAGMRCHPAHPLLAPIRAIDHLRQSAVGKQLRQETWDRHIAAEAVLSDSD
eukprot:jgi/Astpho2/6379/Aster-06042